MRGSVDGRASWFAAVKPRTTHRSRGQLDGLRTGSPHVLDAGVVLHDLVERADADGAPGLLVDRACEAPGLVRALEQGECVLLGHADAAGAEAGGNLLAGDLEDPGLEVGFVHELHESMSSALGVNGLSQGRRRVSKIG